MIGGRTNYLYWGCQIAGWGAYSAIGLTLTTIYTGWHAAIVVGFALFFLYSIALTHALRALIRRQGWLMLPAGRGLPRVFGAALATGLMQASLVLVFAAVMPGGNAFDATAALSTFGGVTFMTCAWSAFYVGISWNRRYRHTQLREVEFQLNLRQADLRALQAQVNPHFLFNCLNTIRGMVMENPARAQEMITSLANLFRRSLKSSGDEMISLAEEMEAVSDYLALETTRFEERLRVSIEVDEEAGRCTLPPMLLQTLVENAVIHGVARLPQGGSIRVRGTKARGSLVISVENTGSIGVPDPNRTHTGLDNSRERLRHFCGEGASLELSDANGMVTATLILPQPA